MHRLIRAVPLMVFSVANSAAQAPAAQAPAAGSRSAGIQGDARPSTKELGRKIFDMKVDYAVKQIRSMVGQK